MNLKRDFALLEKMKPGQVYRRSDLVRYFSSVDRCLRRLVSSKKILKVAVGLYMKPKSSAFGIVPPDESALVKAFLKGDRFLVSSFNNYNQLGLGLTQLYQTNIVYNHKRWGEFKLGGKKYIFKRVSKFPRKISKEYLLVDLLNNLKDLAEDENSILLNLKANKDDFGVKKVLAVARTFGRPRTIKILYELFKLN